MNNLEKFSDYCETKKIAFEESNRLIRRDSQKYTKMVIGLWLMPVIVGDKGVVTDAYLFMRHVDDVIDGDLIIKDDPLIYVENIKKDILNENENVDYPIEKLAFRSLRVLNERRKGSDNPRKEFIDGIDGMLIDNRRMLDKQIFDGFSLRENFIETFSSYVNIFLMAINSKLRSSDVEPLLYGKGFACSIRDLEIDWQRGLINIPKEVLKQANLTTDVKSEEIKSNLVIKEWISEESFNTRSDLTKLLVNISEEKNEKKASFLINGLSKSVLEDLEQNIQPRRIISVSGNN